MLGGRSATACLKPAREAEPANAYTSMIELTDGTYVAEATRREWVAGEVGLPALVRLLGGEPEAGGLGARLGATSPVRAGTG